MRDATRNGKNHQDDYIRFKKTIQEIVGMSKSKTTEKSIKIKKKKQEPLNRSESLMKQFLELKEFQKGLAETTLNGNKANTKNLTKDKEYTESSSGGSSSDKDSISSFSNSRVAINKNYAKEREKRDEYHTDELSDTTLSEDSGQVKECSTEGTVTDVSNSEVTSSKYGDKPKVSYEPAISGKTQKETPSVQPTKKKCTLSPSELAIIKNLCRDLIRKEEKPKEDKVQKPESPIKEVEEGSQGNSDEQVYPKKETEELVKTEQENIKLENQEYKREIENKQNHKYEIQTKNDKNQKFNSEPDNIPIPNEKNVESAIHENILTKEPPASAIGQTKIKEIADYDEESNEEVMNTLIVKGKLTYITEHKEDDTKTTDEKFEKVHLEIMRKGTVEEVDEWKQRIEEKVVIEKTVKVNLDENEVIENETKDVEKEKEVTLCNISDDDLIRKTILEMDQIDQEFMEENASPEEENENYYYGELGDGDNTEEKRSLYERIDRLQEQILSLRKQLEEARRQNEEEAKEICYLSNLMTDRGSTLLRNGLDWDEWELKEMVRERLQQRREAAAQEYQARLKVVDALCSAEMGKLEEALQTLVPLNATVSGWDTPVEPLDVRSSWQTQDYFFEVVTSMNLSSTDANGVSGTISTNSEQPSLKEWKAEVLPVSMENPLIGRGKTKNELLETDQWLIECGQTDSNRDHRSSKFSSSSCQVENHV